MPVHVVDEIQSEMGSHRSLYSDEGYDYGLDEDEGQPTDQTELSPAEDILSNQAQALSLEDFSVTHGPGEAITITSNAIATDPNIRYSIYVPFLHYSGGNYSLETVARAFTSAVISHFPQGKTIHLEFHKPPNVSLSSIIFFHRGILRFRPEMSVGALHNISTGGTRVYPCARSEHLPVGFQQEREPYKVFAVVLDKPDFINENGVLFILTDGGKMIAEPTNETTDEPGPYSDYYETQVWRSAGMAEVARRLGMRALVEQQQQQSASTRRVL